MIPETHAYTAGEMRFPASVERPIDEPDGAGGSSTQWVVVIPILWCHVEQVTGDEKYSDQSGGRVRTFKKQRFTTWWRDDIRTTDRIMFEGVLYNIRTIDNLMNRNKFMWIVAESGVEQ